MKVKQTSLIKFCSKVRSRKSRNKRAIKAKKTPQIKYTLEMGLDQVIRIQETHCLECSSRLVKNGYNNRLVIRDKWGGKCRFRLQRKRCPKCGEIKPDYSQFAPNSTNYSPNFARRARQHYMEGLMRSQIRRVFKIDFGVEVSKSTIVKWINEVEKPLRTVLKETPVPSSGYWCYDEIHMKIGGQKAYALDLLDANTMFVPAAKIHRHMGREEGKAVLKEAKRGRELPLLGLTKDCSTNFGGLFKTRSFKSVKKQDCVTHVKWIISKHVKAFAGLSERSKKPIPQEWKWLLKRFYAVIDAKNETDAYVKLEILQYTVEELEGKKKKHVLTAFKRMEAWLLKIVAHRNDPNLSRTNNPLEGHHKKYKYYPSFKHQMMTQEGAQRVLDYRIFLQNLSKFPGYLARLEKKYERFETIFMETEDKRSLAGHKRSLTNEMNDVTKWYKAYLLLWNLYFARI